MRKFTLLAAAALLAAGPAFAQTQQQRAQTAQGQTGTQGTTTAPGATTAPSAGMSSTGSRAEALTAAEFARMVAMSDMYELESSRLAEQRSQNAQVKQFAQHMVRDHTKTTTELKGMLPQLQGVSAAQLPTSLDQQHQALVQQLQGAQGAQFDRVFMQQQVQAHQMAVDMFSNYARSGDNAQLKQWASQTLPTLQEHLREAQQLMRGTQG
jgi:putative membrane protein